VIQGGLSSVFHLCTQMDKLHQQQLLEFLVSSSKSQLSKKPLTAWWEVFYCAKESY